MSKRDRKRTGTARAIQVLMWNTWNGRRGTTNNQLANVLNMTDAYERVQSSGKSVLARSRGRRSYSRSTNRPRTTAITRIVVRLIRRLTIAVHRKQYVRYGQTYFETFAISNVINTRDTFPSEVEIVYSNQPRGRRRTISFRWRTTKPFENANKPPSGSGTPGFIIRQIRQTAVL